jgi:hypothetical protein
VTLRTVSIGRGLGAVAVVVGLAVSGCGRAREVRVSGRKVMLTLDEYRIVPSTLRVVPGRLKFIVRNGGVLAHNLRVQSLRTDATGNPELVGATPTTHPGETVAIKITLTPGRYRLLCSLGNHADLGQRGTLIVDGTAGVGAG